MIEPLPYKSDFYRATGELSTDCGQPSDTPNPSRFDALERPADAGLTQRLECIPYKDEVGGSNPSARTKTLSYLSGLILFGGKFVSKGHAIAEMQKDGLPPIAIDRYLQGAELRMRLQGGGQ